MVKLSELKDLTTKQLRDVVSKAEEILEERRAVEVKEGRAKIAAIAKDLGYSLSDLIGTKGKKSSAVHSAPPKYRSKTDPTLTWSGRGRMATWLANEIKAGKNKESFLIKD
jgi:DNA-binding protein H-NS